MSAETPETIDDEVADQAAELLMETEEAYQEQKAEQEAIIEEIGEEAGAPLLETKCNIIGERVVPVSAKLNGDLIDRFGKIDARLSKGEEADSAVYEFGQAVRDGCELLADMIDDKTWDATTLLAAYKQEGHGAILTMINNVFDSLTKERERVEGAASGFRASR